jgi:hypothetical protein
MKIDCNLCSEHYVKKLLTVHSLWFLYVRPSVAQGASPLLWLINFIPVQAEVPKLLA